MKWFLLFITLSISSKLLACECVEWNFESRYRFSDFIATAKIISVSDAFENNEYQKVEIEIIELYKGKHISSLSEANVKKTNCGIYTPANTTWLIFASYDSAGILNFGLCSGSIQVDNISYDPKYPNYKRNVEAKIQHTIDILAYLKKIKLFNLNEHGLIINMATTCIQDLKGYETNNQKFAIYEITVSKNLAIAKVKNLKSFDNEVLSQKLLACIKNDATVNTRKFKKIPFKTKVIVIYFYNPGDQNNPSFLSKQVY